MSDLTCSEPDCPVRPLARGLCARHYNRAHAHGTLPGGWSGPQCRKDECQRPAKSRGLCAMHYGQQRRQSVERPRCAEPTCDRAAFARGYCSTHYQRARTVRPAPAFRLAVAQAPLPVEFGSDVLPQRFWRKVTVRPSGCWTWGGALHKGYGNFRYLDAAGQPRRRGTHVVAYEAFIGPLPEGLVCDHLCHTQDDSCYEGEDCPHRACCNPLHIEPVTRRENGQRGHYTYTTHCPAGHAYAEHGFLDARGYELCRPCRRDQDRTRRRRLSEQQAAHA